MTKMLYPYVSVINKFAKGCIAEIKGEPALIRNVNTYGGSNAFVVYIPCKSPRRVKMKKISTLEPVLFYYNPWIP